MDTGLVFILEREGWVFFFIEIKLPGTYVLDGNKYPRSFTANCGHSTHSLKARCVAPDKLTWHVRKEIPQVLPPHPPQSQ